MLEGNPYTVTVQRTRRRFKAEYVGGKPVEVVNTETGEVTVGNQIIGRHKIYDSSDFVKLFSVKELVGLNITALYVLFFLISRLQFGGYAKCDIEEAMLFTGYESKENVYRGLMCLKKADIIRKKGYKEWWINPNIVYRGQRDEFEIPK